MGDAKMYLDIYQCIFSWIIRLSLRLLCTNVVPSTTKMNRENRSLRDFIRMYRYRLAYLVMAVFLLPRGNTQEEKPGWF
ncbi:uncharacterized protein EURHEDRAFT_107031 [Aspergillus ruber CBS 135680]|uniref:Uncharacterized protein n=1 Tax=Aspergillus ruber (strain CBS 135680) TaxID=1388766 RepID=A0A017SAQ0_ASPRC|nr:uncharacterized protein EURHEDRAFT_107031 [Aspergillus ruber CBS 135680]EYE94088.1 hypothetical protein EURHEDRAFT_107031 [Aspergillus ruber CBS 135680]